MKLSKYVGLVKRGHFCNVAHVADSGIWLGTRAAVYRADGLPDMHGDTEIAAVLDIDAKAMQKIAIQENECPGRHDIFGMNLTDNGDLDMNATKFKIAAVKNGYIASCLLCDDGEMIFYDDALLSPLIDVFKESDYVKTVVRTDSRGVRYVVVKNGFDVLAGIMPVQIVDKEFLADLEDFQGRCVDQFFRNEARKARLAEIAAAEQVAQDDGKQTEITEEQEQEE